MVHSVTCMVLTVCDFFHTVLINLYALSRIRKDPNVYWKIKKIFWKKNLTQAKYYTSVIYGSIRMQQEVDAVLINSIVYIHTFIQIAFLWPVLKPLTYLTHINKCQLYMSHISLNASFRMSYLKKLFICENFSMYL